ncbi:hypothetical protein [Massilia consociata]|uniref:Uncharacterized protein n=1 Tax=Massilia consociata TaxID=760117 RepID=A0ABV6FNM0_9BURK
MSEFLFVRAGCTTTVHPLPALVRGAARGVEKRFRCAVFLG